MSAAPTGRRLPRRRTLLVAGVVVLAAAAALAGAYLGRPASRASATPAPALSGRTAAGGSFDLAGARGHWVLVNFFASWCPDCRRELPRLAALQHARPQGLQIVSVDTYDSLPKAAALIRAAGGSWTVVDDPQAVTSYEVYAGLPESFLVDPSGDVVDHIFGTVDTTQLDRDL